MAEMLYFGSDQTFATIKHVRMIPPLSRAVEKVDGSYVSESANIHHD